jgi:hypothetical protein
MAGQPQAEMTQSMPMPTRMPAQPDCGATHGVSPMGVIASPRRHSLLGLSLSFRG